MWTASLTSTGFKIRQIVGRANSLWCERTLTAVFFFLFNSLHVRFCVYMTLDGNRKHYNFWLLQFQFKINFSWIPAVTRWWDTPTLVFIREVTHLWGGQTLSCEVTRPTRLSFCQFSSHFFFSSLPPPPKHTEPPEHCVRNIHRAALSGASRPSRRRGCTYVRERLQRYIRAVTYTGSVVRVQWGARASVDCRPPPLPPPFTALPKT